jgi:RND family efflux transporter MFP subunit
MTAMQTYCSSRNLFLGAALSALLLATGCHRTPHEGPEAAVELPAVSVTTQVAELKPHVLTTDAVGSVQPVLQATLEAKVSGRITKLPVRLGQAVKKGDLIAELSVEEIQAKLAQAEAMQKQAARDMKRYRKLLAQEAVTQAEYDAMEARLQATTAAVKEAKTMLDYALVRAPFDGVITRKFTEVGDLASPGRPIVSLENPGQYQLVADVPETLVNGLKVGAPLRVTVPALQQELEGTIAELAPAADAGSRTFRAKINLPATPGLRSGQFGRAAVPVSDGKALFVPATAVCQRGQLQMVFVVTNQVLQMRLIKTGRHRGELVEILSGLNPGERVVVRDVQQLQDGQPVQGGAGA